MQAMGNSMIEIIPKSWGGFLNVITAVFSVPLTFFLPMMLTILGYYLLLRQQEPNWEFRLMFWAERV